MIKKYQDMIGNILATFVDVVDEDKTYGFYHNSEHYYNTDYYTQNKHYFDELEKLAIEKDEQESRKDKLVVGSKWECVVSCFANDSMYYKVGVKVKVLSLKEYDRELFVKVKSEWQEVMFVVDQFLLCFKPLKEEE